MKAYATNEKEWWEIVNHWWDQIVDMASDQLDLSSPAFQTPGKPESPMTGRTVMEEMNSLKQNQDPKLARYFNAVWGLASDAYAYSKPGWTQLCDLCSEEYVLYENQIPSEDTK